MTVSLEINKRFLVSSRRRKLLCETLVDTVKSGETTCVKENDGIGTVQSIQMLPVTPTSKVLPETNNVNYTLRGKILKKRPLLSKLNRGKYMSKYAVYYD